MIPITLNLAQFAVTPDTISIPLKNCFALAGIVGADAIKRKVAVIAESTEREQLENELGESVTVHINTAWPKHPIKITFSISDGLINFHVHDLNTKGKAKTADQRSDGFRQFVSFLLTISAQNRNDELSNSILLLDEPETHLHPQAQEDLLRELVKITQNKRNNIVFFATHSNHMIDKGDLSRNYKVFKNPNKKQRKRRQKKVSLIKKYQHMPLWHMKFLIYQARIITMSYIQSCTSYIKMPIQQMKKDRVY
jgi:predicted ATP-dependent endonuclease of OLD family